MTLEMIEFDLEALCGRGIDDMIEFFEDMSLEEVTEYVADHIEDYYFGDVDHDDLPDNLWEMLAPCCKKDDVANLIAER